MCSLRLTNATRFISATSVRSNFAKVQILKLISVPSITKRSRHGGNESNVLLNSLNRNSFNRGRSQFNSLADAQVTDQYPRLGKLATLVESVDFQNAVTKFGMLLELNIPDIKDLLAAFIHKSYLIANHKKLQHVHNDNERLAVLGFQTAKQAITEYLLTEFPYLSAEETWDIQNALLDNHVPKVAWDLNIQRFMVFKNQPLFLMMSQTMFALVGTVYIHESPERAADFVRKRLIPELTTETVQHLVKLQHPKLLLKLFAERKGSELPVTKILKEGKSQSRFHLSQPHLYKVGIFEGNKLIAKGASTLLDKAEKEACQKALLSVYMEELNSFNLELSACTSVAENMINFGLTTAGQRVVELFKDSNERLGFRIKGGLKRKGKTEEWLVHWDYSPVFISHIEPGQLADRSGGLKVGDVILAVNDRKLEGLDHERAVKALTSVSGDVTLTVRHSPEVVIADAVETRYKKMKREKRLAEITSEVWGEWHQARAEKSPSKYADVM